jgi:hypothetical protein
MAVGYFLIWVYFYRRYKQSKDAGFKNSFFMGFMVVFLLLMLFSLLYGIYEAWWWNLESTAGVFDLKRSFSWTEVENPDAYPAVVYAMRNQYRPLYLSFYFLLNVVIASLVYPLEQAIGLKKTPFTKMMIVCGALEFLNFIPAIALSYIGVVIIIIGFFGVIIGLFLNIGVNIKLYRDSTGTIRRRSLFAILAFLILGVGLWASMEVGFASFFVAGASYRWDIILGSILQGFAVVFYRIGFGQEGLSD